MRSRQFTGFLKQTNRTRGGRARGAPSEDHTHYPTRPLSRDRWKVDECDRGPRRLAPFSRFRTAQLFWSPLVRAGTSTSTSRSVCMARVFLLALWMAPSAASATRMGSLSLARQPVRPAVLRRPIVLRRTTVLTSSLQDQQTFRAIIDGSLRQQAAFIQQLPVDGARSPWATQEC